MKKNHLFAILEQRKTNYTGAAFAGSIIAGAIISDLSIMGGVSLGFLINVFLFFGLNMTFNSVKETNENNEFHENE